MSPPPTLDFDDWVEVNAAGLLRTAWLLCGDVHLAEDLVQTALLKAYRSWSKVQAADSPVAYVRKIVVRELLSWRRRRSSLEIPSGDPAAGLDVETGYAETDPVARKVAWRLLAGLPRQQRVVLVLRLYHDLDDATIAATIGCSPPAVRSYASRGLATLRAALGDRNLVDGLTKDLA